MFTGCIIVALIYCCFGNVEPFTNLGSTSSGVSVLYSDITAPLDPDANNENEFVITYTHPKVSPHDIVVSYSGLEYRGAMISVFCNISVSASTPLNFTVLLKTGATQIAEIYYISVAYISIDNGDGAFYMLYQNYYSQNLVLHK